MFVFQRRPIRRSYKHSAAVRHSHSRSPAAVATGADSQEVRQIVSRLSICFARRTTTTTATTTSTMTSTTGIEQTPGDHIIECLELTIPIPFGHLAAKWWGRRDCRPIVALHGWQDNAGTFDKLIPLLPRHLGYLAIDLPGHGLSPFQPHGIVYGHMQYLYLLNYVFREHFRWPRVSLLTHSMSSQLMFVYAATFPDYVDLAIGLDSLKPREIDERIARYVLRNINGNWLRTDLRNMNDEEPPTYEYEELIDKMVAATNGSVDRESAPYLLQRGSKPSRTESDRYYFSRDNRLKTLNPILLTGEIYKQMAADIRCPYLLFKSEESAYSENRARFQETVEVLEASNPLFELYGVNGGHHVHLTEPEKVAGKIGRFIGKYRPVAEDVAVEVVRSKL